MSMTAVAAPRRVSVKPATGLPVAAMLPEPSGRDDAEAGRHAVDDRSVWSCAGFYLAIPACAVLVVVVAVVRLWMLAAAILDRGAS